MGLDPLPTVCIISPICLLGDNFEKGAQKKEENAGGIWAFESSFPYIIFTWGAYYVPCQKRPLQNKVWC